ncbi:MAG: Kelch repeat-containing protein [Nitrospirota bacterium]
MNSVYYLYFKKINCILSYIIFIVVPLIFTISCNKNRLWIRQWSNTTPLSVSRSGACGVSVNGFIYVMGGVEANTSGKGFLVSGEYTRIRSNGELEEWKTLPSLNVPRGFMGCVEANGYIYVIGGSNFENGMNLLNSVEKAHINKDGSLGAWSLTTPMRTRRRGVTTVSINGYIYSLGGYNGVFLRTVEMTKVKDHGELKEWQILNGIFTSSRYIHGGAYANGNIYIVGGHDSMDGSAKNSTEWSRINPDNTLHGWVSGPPLNSPRFLTRVAATDNYLYVVGGYNGNYLKSVEKATINKDGSPDKWQYALPLKEEREGAAIITDRGYIYVIGGSNKGRYLNDVEFAAINKDGELGSFVSAK